MGKTSAERQAEYKEKMWRHGYKQITRWVHKHDREKLDLFVKELFDKREEKAGRR